MLLSESWHELVDSDLLYLYRCDGVYFNYGERVHKHNLDKTFQGLWSQFSYKEGATSLIKGFDQKGYKILIARRMLTADEMFDLSIRFA